MSRRPILGLWASRTDAARRTKGDPPPTYAQLETTVAALTATLKTQGEIIRSLRSQADGLIAENTKLRTVDAEKTEYVETLALELAQVKADGICGDAAPSWRGIGGDCSTPVECELRHGHASEWHQGYDGRRWRKAPSAEPKPTLREELLRLEDRGAGPEMHHGWLRFRSGYAIAVKVPHDDWAALEALIVESASWLADDIAQERRADR